MGKTMRSVESLIGYAFYTIEKLIRKAWGEVKEIP